MVTGDTTLHFKTQYGYTALRTFDELKEISQDILSQYTVFTNQGYKNIEDVELSENILSFNFNKNKNEFTKVLKLSSHETTEDIYTLYINGDIIKVTGTHKFYINRNNSLKWIKASELTLNDKVKLDNGNYLSIEKIEKENKTVIVYNMEVEKNHNYYVGNNKILVHNKMIK